MCGAPSWPTPFHQDRQTLSRQVYVPANCETTNATSAVSPCPIHRPKGTILAFGGEEPLDNLCQLLSWPREYLTTSRDVAPATRARSRSMIRSPNVRPCTALTAATRR